MLRLMELFCSSNFLSLIVVKILREINVFYTYFPPKNCETYGQDFEMYLIKIIQIILITYI